MQTFTPGEAREDVELREEQLGEAVHAGRIPQDHGVEPATPPLPAGGRPELVAALPHPVAVRPEVLGRERSRADPGDVRLRDADHTLDLRGPDTGRRQGVAGHRVRGGDEGIRPLIEVEHGPLGSLEQHVPALAQAIVEHLRRVCHVRAQALGVTAVVLDDPFRPERQAAVDLREDGVLLLEDDVQLLAKPIFSSNRSWIRKPIRAALSPYAGPIPRFVVPSAFLPRNRSVTFSSSRWYGTIMWALFETRMQADVEAEPRQAVHLLKEYTRVHHDPIGDHRRDMRIQDARGHQVELQLVSLGD